jgi:hypothetical protein
MSATIVITARNAAATIQRAIRSSLSQGPYPILLVDDCSADETLTLARATGGSRLRTLSLTEHRTLGWARQRALEAVRTELHVGLDADDELLPGRVDRMVATMTRRDDASVVVDEAEIAESGGAVRVAPIPGFIRAEAWPVRLFERNYLPAPGAVGFRTAAARALGYDVTLHGAEDVDILLRAVADRCRFAWVRGRGYRIHATPASHSRQVARQRQMVARALAKHSYGSVARFYGAAGHGRAVTAWALASMAVFRGDYVEALGFVSEAGAVAHHPDAVLEADGPCRRPEAWRVAFHTGTLLALLDRAGAVPWLRRAEQLCPTAEGANNLGVALARAGDAAHARHCFGAALTRYPGFLDARENLDAVTPSRITTHPLRQHTVRDDYQPLLATA